MTRQKPDTLTYLDQQYNITGYSGELFPSPEYFGRKTADMKGPTNCYRGYVGRYAIINDLLTVSTLTMLTDYYAPIEGIAAVPDANLDFSGSRTYHLNLPGSFTGGVIVGQKSVAPYSGLGHLKPYSYQIVLELIFTDGHLQAVHDRSTLSAEVRDRLTNDQTNRAKVKIIRRL